MPPQPENMLPRQMKSENAPGTKRRSWIRQAESAIQLGFQVSGFETWNS